MWASIGSHEKRHKPKETNPRFVDGEVINSQPGRFEPRQLSTTSLLIRGIETGVVNNRTMDLQFLGLAAGGPGCLCGVGFNVGSQFGRSSSESLPFLGLAF
jgi:hypothetical protein